MRTPFLLALGSVAGGCTPSLLYEPRIQVSPYLATYRLRGDTSLSTDQGQGLPTVPHAPESLRAFGQQHHEEDVGVRADIGDGFGGLRLDYYRLDMNTSHYGTLDDGWGPFASGDRVRMRAAMDEFRLGWLQPLHEVKGSWRDRPLRLQLAAGGVLAHRTLEFRAQDLAGTATQGLDLGGDLAYVAARARLDWQQVALDLDYALCPDLALGGDFDGMQQDLELRLGYTVPMRDITVFAGWRYSDFEGDGRQGRSDWTADLILDGFQVGATVSF